MARLIWITGAAGSGKTSLARCLQTQVPSALLLDGEDWRSILGEFGAGYADSDRRRIGCALARLAVALAEQGALVIVATISKHPDVGLLLAQRALVVRLVADDAVLRARRPHLESDMLRSQNADPWPFAVDLTLTSDRLSTASMANRILRQWP
jgi:ABC-type cobalamin/Fe3+-siderophores transport system ATPase subunit